MSSDGSPGGGLHVFIDQHAAAPRPRFIAGRDREASPSLVVVARRSLVIVSSGARGASPQAGRVADADRNLASPSETGRPHGTAARARRTGRASPVRCRARGTARTPMCRGASTRPGPAAPAARTSSRPCEPRARAACGEDRALRSSPERIRSWGAGVTRVRLVHLLRVAVGGRLGVRGSVTRGTALDRQPPPTTGATAIRSGRRDFVTYACSARPIRAKRDEGGCTDCCDCDVPVGGAPPLRGSGCRDRRQGHRRHRCRAARRGDRVVEHGRLRRPPDDGDRRRRPLRVHGARRRSPCRHVHAARLRAGGAGGGADRRPHGHRRRRAARRRVLRGSHGPGDRDRHRGAGHQHAPRRHRGQSRDAGAAGHDTARRSVPQPHRQPRRGRRAQQLVQLEPAGDDH